MRVGMFLTILHSQFSILPSQVLKDDFAKAAGVAKVVVSPPAFCPKRRILAGLVKFLAVGCGLNEIAPSADSSGA